MSFPIINRVVILNRRHGLAAAAVLVALAAVAVPEGHARAENIGSVVIGTSVQGRPLEVTCYNSGDPADDEVVLIVGAIHAGYEAITADLAYELMDDFNHGRLVTPDGLVVCILPELNPDGLVLGQHTNARGVDLNRNWPASNWNEQAWHPLSGDVSGGTRPLSEPETQSLHEFVELVQPSVIVTFHCCGSLVEANEIPDAVFMARRYARAAEFGYLATWASYEISGELIDAMDGLRIPAVDVELEHPGTTGLADHRAGIRSILDYLSGN